MQETPLDTVEEGFRLLCYKFERSRVPDRITAWFQEGEILIHCVISSSNLHTVTFAAVDFIRVSEESQDRFYRELVRRNLAISHGRFGATEAGIIVYEHQVRIPKEGLGVDDIRWAMGIMLNTVATEYKTLQHFI